MHAANEEKAKECTFHPSINQEENLHILKNSELRAEYQEDFLNRQQIFDEHKQRHIQELREKITKEVMP